MGQSSSREVVRSSAKHKFATDPYTVRPGAVTFVGNVMNTGGKNGEYILIELKRFKRKLQHCYN